MLLDIAARPRRRAFTLIELIVVIVILGILAAIASVSYKAVVDRSAVAAVDTTLTSVDREARVLAASRTAPVTAQDLTTAVGDAGTGAGTFEVSPEGTFVRLTRGTICRQLTVVLDGAGTLSDCGATTPAPTPAPTTTTTPAAPAGEEPLAAVAVAFTDPNLSWVRQVGASMMDSASRPGGLYTVGSAPDAQFYDKSVAFLSAHSADGTTQWTRRMTVGDAWSVYARSVVTLADGSAVALVVPDWGQQQLRRYSADGQLMSTAAVTNPLIDLASSGDRLYGTAMSTNTVHMFDLSGTELATFPFTIGESNTNAINLAVHGDTIALGGWANHTDPVTRVRSATHRFLHVMDTSGQSLWTKTYAGYGSSAAKQALEVNGTGVFFAPDTSSAQPRVTYAYTAAGVLRWQATLSPDVTPQRLQVTADGRVHVSAAGNGATSGQLILQTLNADGSGLTQMAISAPATDWLVDLTADGNDLLLIGRAEQNSLIFKKS